MKKIPTIFERDWNGDKSRVLPVPTAAHALLAGAVATRKYDGTSCLVRDGKLYKRYDAKQGKTPPEGFEPCGEVDPETGHWPGWLPVTDAPEDKHHRKAFEGHEPNGTYELCGPKIQNNHEGFQNVTLVPHGKLVIENVPTDFDGLKAFFERDKGYEGIVWWKDGAPVGKIKRRDFGFPWPPK